jgi:hypothetical protein
LAIRRIAAVVVLAAVVACSSSNTERLDSTQSTLGAAAQPGTSCQIIAPTCPKYPTVAGVITDWDPSANGDQAVCLSRAEVFQVFCGTPLPVTADYVVNGVVTGSQTTGGSSPYTSSDVATYYTDLPSFPAETSLLPVAATASTTYPGFPAYNVIAYGTPGSTWNSGTDQPSWILLDFGLPQPIASLQLIVDQAPAGAAHHQVFVGSDPSLLTLALDLAGSFTNDEVLTVHLPDATPPCRYVMVKTLSTVSWVAWGHVTAFAPHAPAYFGFYDSAATFEFVDATPTVQSFSNTSWVFGPTLASDVALLQEAQSSNMGAMLSVQTTFFAGANLLPPSQYEANWTAMAAQVAPYVNNGTIVAFYPFDEPYLAASNSGLTYAQMQSQLETVGSTIKASFPNAKITMLFTINDFATLAQQNIIPTNYDWISFDCYGSWTTCGSHSIPWYLGEIEAHLQAGQRVLLFPDTSIFVPVSATLGYDTYWINADNGRLLNYFQLAQTDPNVIGMFGFLYQNYVTGSDVWLGAADPYMAPVLTTWQSFGSGVMGR